ncbi:integumentary mucin C.1-like [Ischnura elegans]|uniref:integumentary mucin C.1-like n=1 Tax=Ischnura elegans TaxID=197161 RepID=UPI001ED89B35|nr:integumentary mucin C.1-like [Ischnura elegans]
MNCLHLIACLLFLSGSQHVNGFPQASSSAIGNQPLAAEATSAPASEAKEVNQEHGPIGLSAYNPLVTQGSNTTLSPNTTTEPTTTPTTTPTAPTTTVNTPPTTTTTPTTTSSIPPTTSPSTTTTTVAPTTPSSTTTEKPTTVTATSTKAPPTTSTAAPEISRRFDGPSFIGGIVFALGFTAIAFVAWKFYKARTERNYHTL